MNDGGGGLIRCARRARADGGRGGGGGRGAAVDLPRARMLMLN